MKAEKKLIFRCLEEECYRSGGEDNEPCEICMPDLGIMVGGNGIRYPMGCPFLYGSMAVFELIQGTHQFKGEASEDNPIRDRKCIN